MFISLALRGEGMVMEVYCWRGGDHITVGSVVTLDGRVVGNLDNRIAQVRCSASD